MVTLGATCLYWLTRSCRVPPWVPGSVPFMPCQKVMLTGAALLLAAADAVVGAAAGAVVGGAAAGVVGAAAGVVGAAAGAMVGEPAGAEVGGLAGAALEQATATSDS